MANGPSQIVRKSPAILNESHNLSALEITADIETQATAGSIVDDDLGESIRGSFPLSPDIEVPVMCNGHLIKDARTKRVCFREPKIVKMIRRRPIDRTDSGQGRATKLVHGCLSVDIRDEADPVLRTEIVVETSVIRVFSIAFWVHEGETTDRVWQAISPVACSGTRSTSRLV